MVDRTVEEQAILDRIKDCLASKGIEQKELCEGININPQAFTHWNKGNNKSYMKKLPQIALWLDIPVTALFGTPDNSSLTEIEKELLQYFSMCDMSGKLRIIQFAMNEFDRTEKEKTNSEETDANSESHRVG